MEKGIGRPRLPESLRHESVLKLRFTEDQLEMFKAQAASKDVPLAIFLRSVLVDAVAEMLRADEAA